MTNNELQIRVEKLSKKEYAKLTDEEKKQRKKENVRLWHLNNKEKVVIIKRKYYDNNKEVCIERGKAYMQTEKRKEWVKLNGNAYYEKIKARKPHLRLKYGITLEQYDEMRAMQQFRCKTCNKHETEMRTPLHVDHCHISGKIRGLLCKKCNTALGMVKDSKEVLKNLIIYLEGND